MRLLIIALICSLFLAAVPHFGDVANTLPDIEWRAEEGSIAIRITPDLAVSRKEVYLGERLMLAFQVKRPHAPCPLSIRVRDLETGEVVFERSTTANVCGGQVGPGMYWTAIIPDFTIREPVREGRRYKVEIRAGGEYGAYTFTERHNPVGKITSISIERGGRVVTRLAEGEEHVVKVTVQNTGEVDYAFNVTLFLDGVRLDSKRVTVLMRRSAVVELRMTPRGFGTVNLTVTVGGVIITDRQSLEVDVVAPRPTFVLLEPREIEARVGVAYEGTLRLRNVGEACPSLQLSLDRPWELAYTPRPVASGGTVEVPLRFTPAVAERGVAKLTARCGEVTQVLEVPYVVKARVRVRAESVDGRSVPARIVVEGAKSEDEWLPPGRYVVVAPDHVAVGEGSRWRFTQWEDGTREARRLVEVKHNVELVARYVQEHLVELSALGRQHAEWVPAGNKITPPFHPVVQINATHRLVFERWAGGGCGDGFEFVVTAPARCEAVYKREFRLVVVDPLGRHSVDTWTERMTYRVPRLVDLGNGTRWALVGSNCPYTSDGGFALFEFTNAAVCRLEWRREYKIVLMSGLREREVRWEGWLPQGSKVELRRGGEVSAVEGILTLPEVVETASVRYKLRGWTCGGESFQVSSPAVCEGQWDVEYRVRISIYLDGRLQDVKTVWAAGDVVLDAQYYKPYSSTPLTWLRFEKWSAGDSPTISVKVEAPQELSIYWSTDYTPMAAVIAGAVAAAALATYVLKRRKTKKTIEVEVVGGDETKTR